MSSETAANGRRGSRASSKHDQTSASRPTLADNPFELIPLALLDEPAAAIRETMDELQLQELCQSILAVGVIEPLVVERAGERYRVLAGHRRLIACQAAKFSPVPCIVRAPGAVDPAAVTIAENYYREDVNPAEEAAFLDRLLTERCGGDVDTLAALIRHRREYVEDRLLLLRGRPEILDALRQHQISIAVARELNKVKDPGQQLYYLDAAVRGGATAAVVRTWRASGDALSDAAPGAAADALAPPTPGEPAAVYQMVCLFCGESDQPHLIEIVYLHGQCKKFLMRILDRSHEPASEGKG